MPSFSKVLQSIKDNKSPVARTRPRTWLVAAFLGLMAVSSIPIASANQILAEWDFAVLADGLTSPTTTAGLLSDATFNGSNADSRVCCGGLYTSSVLFGPPAAITYMSFTIGEGFLETLSVMVGNNGPAFAIPTIDVLLSSEGASTPTPGSLGTYTNLGSFTSSQTTGSDLQTVSLLTALSPGSYHLAFAPQGGGYSTTQMFYSYASVTGTSVPEPGILALFVLGLTGLGMKSRRQRKSL